MAPGRAETATSTEKSARPGTGNAGAGGKDPPMGYRILNQMTHLSVKLTTAERLVAMVLTQDMADSSASGTPSVDYLAGVCDLRVRTVKKALLRLEALGLLSRQHGRGRAVGPRGMRTTLYVWNEAAALGQALSDKAILRRGMASRAPSDQRRKYGCLVSEMDDAGTPSVLADERPDEGGADEPSSSASAPETAAPDLFSAPSSGASSPEPAPEPAPEAEPEPTPAAPASGGFPSHPEWRRYEAAFLVIGKRLNRFSVRAWVRFVQQDGMSPQAIDARAALAADCAEQYVKDLRAELRGFEAAKGYAKSAEAFLAEGEWRAHRPCPEAPQPEPGEAMEDRCGGESAPEVPFEERYADYARAAAGDEAAIEALRRVLPSRFFEAPAGVPARWPGLIGVLGLRESFASTAEDRAAFAQAADGAGEGVPESSQGPEEPSGEVPEPVCEEASQGADESPEAAVSWEVAPVGEPSEEYLRDCARPWEPHFEPPAPPPAASPDAPVADDEWGIASAERAALSAPYSAVGSAEEFREQAALASQGTLGGWE